MDAQDMGNALERILVTEDELARRMAELAAEIDADYQGKEILLVGVLKGAVMVVADLSRHRYNIARSPPVPTSTLLSRWTGWPFPPTVRALSRPALSVSSKTSIQTSPGVMS